MKWSVMVHTVGTCVALASTYITNQLGGYDFALHTWISFVVIDIATGLLKGFISKNMASKKMFIGGVRKLLILLVIYVAVSLDHICQNSTPIFRTMTLYYYSAMEGLSLVENLDAMGVPLPPFLVNALESLKAKNQQQK